MSSASASITLTLLPDIGTFSQYLLCNKGDLRQMYEGDPTSPSSVTPNYAQTQPVISLYVQSSRQGGIETPEEVVFTLNNVTIGTITKNGTTYTKQTNSDYTSYFQLLSPDENNGQYGLKIKDNLCKLTATNGQIFAKFKISDGTSYADLQASIPYTVTEVTTNSSMVVIEAGDLNNFVITEKNSSAILSAVYYQNGSDITNGNGHALTYKWYQQEYGANPTGGALANWVELTGKTGSTLTVTEGMVNTARLFMVHVFDNGEFVGQDTQIVHDRSDTFEVISTADKDVNSVKETDSVQITSNVFRRGSTTPLTLTGATWTYIGTTPAGTPVLSNSSASNVCTVSGSDVKACGGILELMISVEWNA